ncbi:MAG: LacI family DNA-binding transcriptional regulator [Nitratireductor sp.]|nr:LacI family DNA-binding transcriptional regulator [Nitratireductor sp.]MCC0021024.1 LacI family DNA-binding transcriptional regulator [Nitratireductor sp.]
MPKRPTLHDLAREAGVSIATVDRVLNGRAPVREETAKRIYEAAHRIGYHAASVIKQRMQADMPVVHFGFILQKERQYFYQRFAEAIAEAVRTAPGVRGIETIEFAATSAPDETAALIEKLSGRTNAIAAVSINHHAISTAVQSARERNVPVFSLLSDFAPGLREAYVGLNNLQIGRIAGWMIAKAARSPGKVAIYVGGHRWHGHDLREAGFRSYFREHAQDFHILDTLVNLETRQLTYEATLDLLHRHPDLCGLYVAGGGMEGAIAAVRETRQPDEIALVVNELTPESRAGLQERYVTLVDATPLPRLCTELIGLMTHAALNGVSGTPGQHFLEPNLYTPESV